MKFEIRSKVFLALALLGASALLSAADTPFEFSNHADQLRYEQLLEQLRCLVCQNQTLADSHADLAQDLRNEVFRMINEGRDDTAIRAFLVQRYGEFVLYKPPLQATTVALWAGPPFLLLVVALIWRRVARHSSTAQAALTEAERAALSTLADTSRKQ